MAIVPSSRSAWILATVLAGTLLAGCAASDDAPATTPAGDEGFRRPSTVGAVAYEGPRTAEGLKAHCNGGGHENFPCYTETLQAYLQDDGSVAAFRLLDELTRVDPDVNTQAHTLSHELGKFALKVYGTIELTLRECSYEVFQGCLHGALQAYFDSLSTLDADDYDDICPTDTRFKEYACLHGLGHGLVLYSKYNLTASLPRCDVLSTDFARSSCHGGAFMENMVAYMDHQNGAAEGHSHADMANVTFMIDPSDPYYPCNAVAKEYQSTCWLLQTSLILYHNNRQGMPNDENFRQATTACTEAPQPHVDTCFRSLGRDASAYANSQCGARSTPCFVEASTTWCGYADAAGRALCVKGVVAEVVLNFANPEQGLVMCERVTGPDVVPCFEELGAQAAYMVGRSELEKLCGRAAGEAADACRRGAGLPG